MQPEQQNQYDFILDPGQNQRNGGPNFGSKKRQLFIGVAFAVVVLLVVGIIASLFLSSGSSNNDGLIGLQSHQTEINRVITLGQKNIADPQIKQILGTLQTSITSDQRQIAGVLSSRGAEVTKLQLSAKKDKSIDTELADALKTGDHDEVLQQFIKSLVDKYYSSLNQSLIDASSSKEKAVINTSISSIETIYTTN